MNQSISHIQTAHGSARIALFSSVIIVVFTAATSMALAQVQGPSESKGVSLKTLGTIDLSTEVEGLSGRQLRARVSTIEPGGHVAWHSHKDRPTLEYVVQGNVVEIRNGVEIQRSAGEVAICTSEVSHWWQNRGTTPVVLLPVDIVKQ
jgi:quercetin dioxygenase-like cupin family protein